MTRKVKVVTFTYDDVSGSRVEDRVNCEIDNLVKQNNKIVSIAVNSFGISPILLVYSIIYQPEKV